MPNMNAIINAHNKRVLNPNRNENESTCNCRDPELCPVDGKCLATGSLYEASLSADIPRYEEKKYKGIAETALKLRIKNHEKSFNHQKYKSDSALSAEYWNIKNNGGIPHVKWKILRKCRGYNPQSKQCALCLNEKLEILDNLGPNQLNKRNEVVSKCRHQTKYLLSNIDSKD